MIRWMLWSWFVLMLAAPAAADEVTVGRWRNADAATQAAALALARRAFDAYALRREIIEPPAHLPPIFAQRTGVFVSAMRGGAPRCCMGTLYPTESNLAREIIANAVAASGRDRRFAPISAQELPKLTLIVTIVGPPRSISPAQAALLDPVTQGLAVRFGDRYGVVLTGETNDVGRMVRWARIRAGAKPTDAAQFFELDDVRFLESGKETPVPTQRSLKP